jgi:hypothetical protein
MEKSLKIKQEQEMRHAGKGESVDSLCRGIRVSFHDKIMEEME